LLAANGEITAGVGLDPPFTLTPHSPTHCSVSAMIVSSVRR
jgi:hypothetical protein